MTPRPRSRNSSWRLARAIWRYRGRIAAHGDRYQAELATAVKTSIDQRAVVRAAFATYRMLMRVLLAFAIFLAVVTIVGAVLLFRADPQLTWFAVVGLIPVIWLFVLRFSWGAPLDWIEEYADPTRQVSIEELPGNLRAIAQELRGLTDVPANISAELDALATEVESENGPHVVA